MAQPLAVNRFATGHRNSVCSRNSINSLVESVSCRAAYNVTVPETRCNRAGIAGGVSIGSARAPLSSRSAVSANSSRSKTTRGVIFRATKTAVACVHPMSAASRVSIGCGAVSRPPMMRGRSVCRTCPVLVVTRTPLLLFGRVVPWRRYLLQCPVVSDGWSRCGLSSQLECLEAVVVVLVLVLVELVDPIRGTHRTDDTVRDSPLPQYW